MGHRTNTLLQQLLCASIRDRLAILLGGRPVQKVYLQNLYCLNVNDVGDSLEDLVQSPQHLRRYFCDFPAL